MQTRARVSSPPPTPVISKKDKTPVEGHNCMVFSTCVAARRSELGGLRAARRRALGGIVGVLRWRFPSSRRRCEQQGLVDCLRWRHSREGSRTAGRPGLGVEELQERGTPVDPQQTEGRRERRRERHVEGAFPGSAWICSQKQTERWRRQGREGDALAAALLCRSPTLGPATEREVRGDGGGFDVEDV
jgi:hypothetical protein